VAVSRAAASLAAALVMAGCSPPPPPPSAVLSAALIAGNRDWTVDEATQRVSVKALGRLQARGVNWRSLWECVTGLRILGRVSIEREEIRGKRAVVFYRPVFNGKPTMWCTWGMQPVGRELILPTDLPCREVVTTRPRPAPDALCQLAGIGCRPLEPSYECTGPENYDVLVWERGEWRLSFTPGSGLGARLIYLNPDVRDIVEQLAAERD